MGLAYILMQKLASLPLHLVGSCSGNRAYDLATLFRFAAADALSGYFAMGWKAGYPSLTKLVGAASESSQALVLAGRLLGETPSPASLDALEAKIRATTPPPSSCPPQTGTTTPSHPSSPCPPSPTTSALGFVKPPPAARRPSRSSHRPRQIHPPSAAAQHPRPPPRFLSPGKSGLSQEGRLT